MKNKTVQNLIKNIGGDLDKLESLGDTLPNNKKVISLPDEWYNGIKIDFTRQPIDKMIKPENVKVVNEVAIETENDMPDDTVVVFKAILKILKDMGTKVRILPTEPMRKVIEESGVICNVFTPFAKYGSGIPPEDKDTPPPAVFFERPSAPYFRAANWVYGNNRDGIPVLQGFKPHGRNMAATSAAMYYGADLKSLVAASITFSGSGITEYDPQGFKLKEYSTSRLIKYSSMMDIPVFNISMSDSVHNFKVHIKLMLKKFHNSNVDEGGDTKKTETRTEKVPTETRTEKVPTETRTEKIEPVAEPKVEYTDKYNADANDIF